MINIKNSEVLRGFRGHIIHFIGNPKELGDAALQTFSDGLLVVNKGKVVAVGDFARLRPYYSSDMPVVDYAGKFIMSGFIDSHVHFPQVDVIASYAEQLLPWLEKYTFPAELQCENSAYVEEISEFFLQQLLLNGTTTAVVFGSVHASALEIFFTVAQRKRLRLIAGKCLMDRHCPERLQDAEVGIHDTERLIQSWHGRYRLEVAITPRFAPTSTEQQLTQAGELSRCYPSVRIQTHVAENKDEVEWVRALFPRDRSYLEVYARFGLLKSYSVYAHGIYLDNQDLVMMKSVRAVIAASPTSNLFLGSGLFDFERAWHYGVATPLATDVGAGTSYSMFRTMQAAYCVARLNKNRMSPLDLFYWATLGAAESLGLSHCIGSLAVGNEADFIVINPRATAVLARRIDRAESIQDVLFALAILADERAIEATYILGDQI